MEAVNLTTAELARFFSKVNIDGASGCWNWTSFTEKGYSRFWLRGRSRSGYRVVYEWACGPIQRGLEIDHVCRNRACVNPLHLEAVTHTVNMSRGAHALKTHCPAGHAYLGGNILLGKKGQRNCRLCGRQRMALYYRKYVKK